MLGRLINEWAKSDRGAEPEGRRIPRVQLLRVSTPEHETVTDFGKTRRPGA